MKKIIKKIVILIIVILLLQLILYIFKTKHNINYVIVNNNEKIKVNEIFSNNNYLLNINYDDKKFVFSYENKFYKSKKIIKNIEIYNKKDLTCIYPILKNNQEFNIICSKDDVTYHYNYFKEDLIEFVNILKDKGYYNSSWEDDGKKVNMGNLIVYPNNINKNTYIYIWKYNGFYSISSLNQETLDILKNDTYVNDLGVRVGKYYILPNYDEKYTFSNFYILNMTNNKVKTLKLDKKITNDYYNNGVVDNNLYLFDLDNLIQYKINPRKNKILEIGNKNKKGLYYDGNNFIKKNIYDFKEEKLIFKEKNNDIPFSYDSVFSNKNNYYYIDNDNNFIYYNDFSKNKMILFNIKNIKSVKLINENIYFISEDFLFTFNIKSGIKKIVKYSELYFNSTNRYDVYEK